MNQSIERTHADVKRAHRNAQRKVRSLRHELAVATAALVAAKREAEVFRSAILQLTREATTEATRCHEETGASRYYAGYLAALRHLAKHDHNAHERLTALCAAPTGETTR